MQDIIATLVEGVAQTSLWEWAAVITGLIYLALAMRENNLCWLFAFVSTVIYTLLFWDVNLLMDSALNVYYMLMAVYGWWYWRRGGLAHGQSLNSQALIRRWPPFRHGLALIGVLLATTLSGYLMTRHTDAAWPYVDSFTTWASVLTTWMVAQKILENWLYWIVIDAVSLVLYVDRGLYLTALLFAAYVIIVIFGFFNWLKSYRAADISSNA